MNRVKAWLACLTILFLIGCGGKPESDSNETGSSKTGSNATQSSSPPEVDIATAISEGNVQAVEQHLAAGTDPNHKDPTSGSPILNAAAVYGHREIVEALLKEGAKVTETDREGNSALHAAAFLGRSEVVELLLEKGADANAKNNRGQSPMDSVAADWQTTQFIANLLQIEVDQQKVEAGRAKSLALLTNSGGKSSSGGGGLLAAVRKQDVAAVKQALADGADANGQDAQIGVTALGWASLNGNVEIARLLIDKQANVNGKSRDGGSPLHGAIFMGHAAIVEVLLNKGADVNAKNGRGELPQLGASADAGTTRFITGMLQLKYDLDEVEKGRLKCLDLLKNGTGARELCAAVRKQDTAAVKQLLDKKTNANVQDPDLGITALAWAAYHGNVEIAGLLIASKADVNGKNRDGSRPLHAAAFTGHSDVLELLLGKGADANAQNDDDETPLQSTEADPATTKVVAGLLQLKLDAETVEQGRAKCIELLNR
jgi:ankyrin repeat protein